MCAVHSAQHIPVRGSEAGISGVVAPTGPNSPARCFSPRTPRKNASTIIPEMFGAALPGKLPLDRILSLPNARRCITPRKLLKAVLASSCRGNCRYTEFCSSVRPSFIHVYEPQSILNALCVGPRKMLLDCVDTADSCEEHLVLSGRAITRVISTTQENSYRIAF